MTTDALLRIAEAKRLGTSGRGRRVREAAHISQSEIALHVGVDQAIISHWETGRYRVPDNETALRWLDAIEVLEAAGYDVENSKEHAA